MYGQSERKTRKYLSRAAYRCRRTESSEVRSRSAIAGFLAARWYEDLYSISWLNLSSPEHKQVQRWGKKKILWNISSRHIFKMIPTVERTSLCTDSSSPVSFAAFHSQAGLFVFIPSKAGLWNIIKNVSNIYWQLLYCYCLPVSGLAWSNKWTETFTAFHFKTQSRQFGCESK